LFEGFLKVERWSSLGLAECTGGEEGVGTDDLEGVVGDEVPGGGCG
jgi:hypothetical protein